MRTLKLIRNVTRKECSWLDKDFKMGETVYPYHDCTYGCISPNGRACVINPNGKPFFELPNNALIELY